jgi:Bacterial protein of unknown function (DUF885)
LPGVRESADSFHERWLQTHPFAASSYGIPGYARACPNRTEIDRYIVLPGQALSYLIGKRELVRLRDEATRSLGPRFALPDFSRRRTGQRVPADAGARREDPQVGDRRQRAELSLHRRNERQSGVQ